jgi:hypothetical protein
VITLTSPVQAEKDHSRLFMKLIDGRTDNLLQETALLSNIVRHTSLVAMPYYLAPIN